MKMKIEFGDHDDFDDIIRKLAEMAWLKLFAKEYDHATLLVELLKILTGGEIVEA